MMKFCKKTEKEIITNYELFSELIEKVFGNVGNSKILFPINLEIGKIGTENTHQEEKDNTEKSVGEITVLQTQNN